MKYGPGVSSFVFAPASGTGPPRINIADVIPNRLPENVPLSRSSYMEDILGGASLCHL